MSLIIVGQKQVGPNTALFFEFVATQSGAPETLAIVFLIELPKELTFNQCCVCPAKRSVNLILRFEGIRKTQHTNSSSIHSSVVIPVPDLYLLFLFSTPTPPSPLPPSSASFLGVACVTSPLILDRSTKSGHESHLPTAPLPILSLAVFVFNLAISPVGLPVSAVSLRSRSFPEPVRRRPRPLELC
jgi:hypothetical protein